MLFDIILNYFRGIAFLSALLISLASCKLSEERRMVRIGVTAGPHDIIMQEVKKKAHEAGISIEIIEFNDFVLPNAALDQGDLDANCYQHIDFLEDQMKNRGYKFAGLGPTILLPMGIYSKKHKSLDTVPDNALVVIPNDPTNEGRALRLLEHAGLIKLKPGVSHPVPMHIIENPKNLKIKEIDSPQLPLSLKDVELAVINTDWVILAGGDLSLAIYWEKPDRDYANLFVVRAQDKNNPTLKKILSIYQSDSIKEFIARRFKNAVITAWDAKG